MVTINNLSKDKLNNIDIFVSFDNLVSMKKQPGENCNLNSDCANNYCMPVEVNGLATKECV